MNCSDFAGCNISVVVSSDLSAKGDVVGRTSAQTGCAADVCW